MADQKRVKAELEAQNKKARSALNAKVMTMIDKCVRSI